MAVGVVVAPLRASPSAAPRIREMAGPGMVIEGDTHDGGVVARRRGTLDDTGRALELVPWILGRGADLEVLEPEGVRKEVAGVLRRAAGLYASVTGADEVGHHAASHDADTDDGASATG